uniref:LIM and calponin homology domains 1a n=1 Tax=Tetraodon nigroviridis TaxID=99883 RepID=H3DMT7_TETNG
QAVTGKSFGDKDFRSGLENGILLCELLSAIKPGLVKKINRLPTPIAGLDNLSVFLRGCEELGLRGAQLFDPGDLQDTSIRANLKDSDCNRKLKNVLNTVFWLGKAAGSCASYSGPSLNLKEFEGLLAQMKVESEEGGDSPQKRSFGDSGYDCWDSERSESLSPPRHTRDNSLDSLDSFGSRSQHSPSPDVVNRAINDGRGSDSEVDAQGKRPDVRKDDMSARRSASGESRSSILFNQFLPNRTNASSYIPAPRRRPPSEEGEQRRKIIIVAPQPPSPQPPFLPVSVDLRSASMGDIINEDEMGHSPSLSQSRYERMHEQYNNLVEEEDHWQDELARWKNRRRSASQELIRKEEERKRMEKRLKEEGSDTNKRKSIKTYKEIVEDKERREAELCEAYKNAASPEEAAVVLQRYALRFTISDATLDSLKVPRAMADLKQDTSHMQKPCTTESPNRLQKQAIPEETWSQITQVQPSSTQPAHTLPSPSSATPRPVPLLAAKPYRQPRNSQPGHKPVKMDGLVRVNGEVMEDPSVSAAVGSSQSGPQEIRDLPPVQKEDLPPAQPATKEETEKQRDEKTPAPQTDEKTPAPQRDEKTRTKDENLTTFSGSAISSLLGVRNCVTTTTIVTELTQTRVEPHNPPAQSGGQQIKNEIKRYIDLILSRALVSISRRSLSCPLTFPFLCPVCLNIETPMLNLAKRVNHWVWDPNEERKRLESWQQEQERLLQEQYRNEQEKLKKEWEKAQLEVEEEERKHIEEERRILEETVTHLTPTGLACQQSGQTAAGSPGNSETVTGNAPLQVNGHRAAPGKEDQHASKDTQTRTSSKLAVVEDVTIIDSASDVKPLKKQELWKTASLDRNPQLNQAQVVKRLKRSLLQSADLLIYALKPQIGIPRRRNEQTAVAPSIPAASFPQQGVCVSVVCRCVSGKRLCSGCSQPLEKGAAMIIDTLGLFFHMQCFKCGVCNGQLGDTTTGTDVRIRNGLLSCYECYIASRGRGQPTTL